jgi:hypothetical protein
MGKEGLPCEIRIGSVFVIAVSPSDTVGRLLNESPITRQLSFRDSGALKSTVALKICGANCTWHTWICPLCEKLPVCGLAGCSWSSDSPCAQAMSGRKCTTRTRHRYAFSGCNVSCASISLLYAQKKPLPRAFSDGRSHVQMLAREWRCGRIPADWPRCKQRKPQEILE